MYHFDGQKKGIIAVILCGLWLGKLNRRNITYSGLFRISKVNTNEERGKACGRFCIHWMRKRIKSVILIAAELSTRCEVVEGIIIQ
mmetsp:Transcript_16121/g.17461  ORF Transcript_16121/g.17461 Transcript_16121/m.17461 type:complete len:86 (+) Transcript_16121:576-833(+)